ncbi:MAG: hypothetical protein A3H98_11820 [Bacteroidetes bacterium RIFCSPLOWO2_02_FULL_36_8]|nr:MAG: hypothetical protein A3H98_11820 [Bacteroidetes bacterium RIFCSPLOWO2_02_FULL_36_8]OFY69461.1 MAG: hypothetical protein A3G23_00830 [Bacteroidetes bacterium RIFCSPLOWO2_12_FULL_37_12]
MKYVLNGYVKDSLTGEGLAGATIYLPQFSEGTHSNVDGYFVMNLNQEKIKIQVTFIGYKTYENEIIISEQPIIIKLTPESYEMNEVVIKDTQEPFFKHTKMSSVNIDPLKLQTIPTLAGERDLLKILQLMPGVKGGGEGSSGIYTRGGGADQNLILLDEALIYNPSHLFGFFSVFNSDIVKNVELQKSGFSAVYGGKLSSIIDITSKEANYHKFSSKLTLGLISSRFFIEFPLKKEKSSLWLSGRRTYVDLITQPFNNTGNNYYFYDLNGKFSAALNQKNRIFLSFYHGGDQFSYNQKKGNFKFDLNWGNRSASCRWNHIYNPQVSSGLVVYYSEYKSFVNARPNELSYKLLSGVSDLSVKNENQFYVFKNNKFKAGIHYIYQTFLPAESEFSDNSFNEFNKLSKDFSHVASLFAEDEFQLNEKIIFTEGIRHTLYKKGNVTYQKTEPRFHSRIITGERSSVKLNYTRMNQFVHQVSNSTTSFPTDVWIPSSAVTKPQESDQLGLSYSRLVNFFATEFETTFESYYKKMRNLAEFREGAQVFVNPSVNDEIVYGEGDAYGIEILVQKKAGRVTGWVGYTLSWSNRKFQFLNNGVAFPARIDRRHDINIVSTYKITENWNASVVWVFYTGNAVTIANGRYVIDNTVYYDYPSRNSVRMPSYHRLDISVNREWKKKKYSSELSFSIYNIYNRQNPFIIFFEERYTENRMIYSQSRQVTLFPIIPSISYTVSF